MNVNPSTNVPTVATLAVAFLTSLISWGVEAIPESVPTEVTVSGYSLLVFAVALAAGKLAQRFTWAEETVDLIKDAELVISEAERGEHG